MTLLTVLRVFLYSVYSDARKVAAVALLATTLVAGCSSESAVNPPSAAAALAAAAEGESVQTRLTYKPRNIEDSSGLREVTKVLDPWSRGASLAEIGAAFTRIGYRVSDRIDQELASPSVGSRQAVEKLISKTLLLNFEGETRKSCQTLAEVRQIVDREPELARDWLYSIIYLQGIVALRQGETDNCVMCRGESSCILPISPAALHKDQTGSRDAIHYFTEYLEKFPDDVGVQWLLNVAHMTLGEHPDKVDRRYLISIERFCQSEFDIGRFRDQGHVAGVNRFNQAGGAVMEDVDNDGLLDVIITSFDPDEHMAFFRNTGNGRFEDRTESAGLLEQLGGLNVVQADYNNDGLLDLFISRGAWMLWSMPQSLLRNDGGGKFTDVTAEAGLLDPVNSNSAAWADFDNDGWIDLYVTSERQTNRLYRNQRDGTFVEISADAGVQQHERAYCKGVTWLDIDNDRDPDLFLNNLGEASRLYRNEGNGTFSDVSYEYGIDGPAMEGFGCWAWDYDNDGWLDIFATSYERSLQAMVLGVLQRPDRFRSNGLFRNSGGKGFENRTDRAGLDFVYVTMGCNIADFDNDGFLDMYLGTGAPGYEFLVPNRMIKNVGGERFSDITVSSGTGHLQKGHGVACGDWDRDGDVDLFVETGGATNGDRFHDVLFQNPGQPHPWLNVKLIGKQTNRAAIGARIKVVTAGTQSQTIHRHVSSGSSFGSNPLEQHIGLGPAEKVARLEIYWPTSDTTQVFENLAVNQALEITEFDTEVRQRAYQQVTLSEAQ